MLYIRLTTIFSASFYASFQAVSFLNDYLLSQLLASAVLTLFTVTLLLACRTILYLRHRNLHENSFFLDKIIIPSAMVYTNPFGTIGFQAFDWKIVIAMMISIVACWETNYAFSQELWRKGWVLKNFRSMPKDGKVSIIDLNRFNGWMLMILVGYPVIVRFWFSWNAAVLHH